uniref:Uncharacterized protein n=1 Tax=Oryza rufipogon TaxID=4529 RepID=A0A0E0Q733_ORYRU
MGSAIGRRLRSAVVGGRSRHGVGRRRRDHGSDRFHRSQVMAKRAGEVATCWAPDSEGRWETRRARLTANGTAALAMGGSIHHAGPLISQWLRSRCLGTELAPWNEVGTTASGGTAGVEAEWRLAANHVCIWRDFCMLSAPMHSPWLPMGEDIDHEEDRFFFFFSCISFSLRCNFFLPIQRLCIDFFFQLCKFVIHD